MLDVATLSEWNVVIYGTKDAPDAKNRAATVQKQQQQPTPTVVVAHAEDEKHLPKSIQTGADQQDAAAVTTAKPSVHMSDEENRTPVFSSPESVPVVSSAATRCLPGQWDSTAAVCLSTCLVSLLVASSNLVTLIRPVWRRFNPATR